MWFHPTTADIGNTSKINMVELPLRIQCHHHSHGTEWPCFSQRAALLAPSLAHTRKALTPGRESWEPWLRVSSSCSHVFIPSAVSVGMLPSSIEPWDVSTPGCPWSSALIDPHPGQILASDPHLALLLSPAELGCRAFIVTALVGKHTLHPLCPLTSRPCLSSFHCGSEVIFFLTWDCCLSVIPSFLPWPWISSSLMMTTIFFIKMLRSPPS